MNDKYDITMANEVVGTATLTQEGLYWKICCQCELSGEVPYQVIAMGDEEINLGLLVREKNDLCLTKRIPMKRFGNVQPSFVARPRTPKTQRNFHPIVPEEPFSYIEKLKDAFLEEKNGQLGITLAGEDQGIPIQDSGLIQEYPDEFAPE